MSANVALRSQTSTWWAGLQARVRKSIASTSMCLVDYLNPLSYYKDDVCVPFCVGPSHCCVTEPKVRARTRSQKTPHPCMHFKEPQS